MKTVLRGNLFCSTLPAMLAGRGWYIPILGAKISAWKSSCRDPWLRVLPWERQMMLSSFSARCNFTTGIALFLGTAALGWCTAAGASPASVSGAGGTLVASYERQKCPAQGDDEVTAKGHFLEGLALTVDQTTAVRSLGEDYRVRFHALAERSSVVRQKLRETPPDDPDYASAVDAAAQEISLLSAEGVRLAAQMWSEVYALLTPEQQRQLRDRLDKEQERWNDWRQRHLPSGSN